MTKEELREHCKKQVKMCEEWAKGNGREPSGKIYEEHKLILDLIKSLEQQPCDDCVSRAEILEEMAEREKNGDRITLGYIKNMSPVTPTHGTCKDCKHNDSKNNNMCRMGHRFALRESEYFYCADFKK